MTRIRRKTALAGVDFSLRPGGVLDVTDDIARDWIEAGHAEVADGEEITAEWPEMADRLAAEKAAAEKAAGPTVETATVTPPETADANPKPVRKTKRAKSSD
ncbi:hypothetical protein B1759_14985 [Rubrivirga sp. SAORIC476]|uniref:hypothetical protein n=1 Tax=Rubrivirga sp. SAORIC476 TaxID=1961794 RepID=UPI000BA95C31|nr:hypothetical protein [Rubrivirga sp. SAORIC476]PAP79623.1 hypothetical protein B1759_14985 [Rubrivirga sp. SAORIC476]